VRLPSRTPRVAVPYPEPGAFSRAGLRTTVVRVALALAVVASAALLVGIARGGGITEAAYLPTGGTNVVVIDFSYSITGGQYRLIVNALRRIAAAGRPVGLIGFSDVAYEMLPPGSPARELEPVARLFVPTIGKNGSLHFPPSPWEGLQGGTRISTGLFLADDALRTAHVGHASVLLISDLETTSDDASAVVDAVGQLRRDGYSLHLVGLDPTGPSLHFFQGLAGKRAFVSPQSLSAPLRDKSSSGLLNGQTQWAFLLGAALLALLVAANERLCWNLDLSGLRRSE
jgi:hypothetical protein